MEEIKDKVEIKCKAFNELAERSVPAHPGQVHRAPTTTGLNVKDVLTVEERNALNAKYDRKKK